MVIDWDEYERWMRQARHTFRLIDADIEHEGYSWACFKAQQVAEFALKALLRALGRPAFGHDLRELFREVRELCGEPPREVARCISLLDKMYVATRYPDAFPSGAPFEHYDRDDAEEAKSCAERVLEWVETCAQRLRESACRA